MGERLGGLRAQVQKEKTAQKDLQQGQRRKERVEKKLQQERQEDYTFLTTHPLIMPLLTEAANLLMTTHDDVNLSITRITDTEGDVMTAPVDLKLTWQREWAYTDMNTGDWPQAYYKWNEVSMRTSRDKGKIMALRINGNTVMNPNDENELASTFDHAATQPRISGWSDEKGSDSYEEPWYTRTRRSLLASDKEELHFKDMFGEVVE